MSFKKLKGSVFVFCYLCLNHSFFLFATENFKYLVCLSAWIIPVFFLFSPLLRLECANTHFSKWRGWGLKIGLLPPLAGLGVSG